MVTGNYLNVSERTRERLTSEMEHFKIWQWCQQWAGKETKAGCSKNGSQITASAGLAEGLENGSLGKEMGSEMPHTHRRNGRAPGQDQLWEEKVRGCLQGWGLRRCERMNKVEGNAK